MRALVNIRTYTQSKAVFQLDPFMITEVSLVDNVIIVTDNVGIRYELGLIPSENIVVEATVATAECGNATANSNIFATLLSGVDGITPDMSDYYDKGEIDELFEQLNTNIKINAGDIAKKQDVIEDLDAIRAGAKSGESALQREDVDAVIDGKSENPVMNRTVANSLEQLNKNIKINAGDIAKKQDVIEDLDAIRAGAGVGVSIKANGIPIDQVKELSEGTIINNNIPVAIASQIPIARANRFAFLADDEIKVEMSTDAGNSWTTNTIDDNTRKVFIGNNRGYIPMGSTLTNQMRITITPQANRYCDIDWLYFWVSAPYATKAPTRLKIEYNTQSNRNIWTEYKSGIPLTGQAGPNIIPYNRLFAGATAYDIRFTISNIAESQTPTVIYGIEAHGTRAWNNHTTYMAQWDHLYSVDAKQNAIFPAGVKTVNGDVLVTGEQRLTDGERKQIADNLSSTNLGLARYTGEGVLPVRQLSVPNESSAPKTYAFPHSSDADKGSATGGVLMTQGDVVELAKDLKGHLEATPETFTYRATAGEVSVRDGEALIRRIKGNTVVWNQMIENPTVDDTTWTIRGIDLGMRMGLRCVSVDFTQQYIMIQQKTTPPPKAIEGHIYYVTFVYFCDSVAVMQHNGQLETKYVSATDTPKRVYYTSKGIANAGASMLPNFSSSKGSYMGFGYYNLVDLTLMYGEGNEPTAEEFRAVYNKSYYSYSTSILTNMCVDSIRTVGLNQLNVDDALSGTINPDTGETMPSDLYSVAPMRVLPDKEYHLKDVVNGELQVTAAFYDIGNVYIGYAELLGPDRSTSGVVITPPAAYTMRVCYHNSKSESVCAHLRHSGLADGKCEPYWSSNRAIPEVNALFPYGMCRVGEVYDEITSEQAIRRCGVRSYETGDVNSESMLTDGATTVYVLDEPVVIPITTPMQLDYKIADFGTEEMVSEFPSAPFSADIVYQFNAVDRIRDNSRNVERLEIRLNRVLGSYEAKSVNLLVGPNFTLEPNVYNTCAGSLNEPNIFIVLDMPEGGNIPILNEWWLRVRIDSVNLLSWGTKPVQHPIAWKGGSPPNLSTLESDTIVEFHFSQASSGDSTLIGDYNIFKWVN